MVGIFIEKMKKNMGEKNSRVEILNNFQPNLANTHSKNPENAFVQEIKEIHENMRHKLLIENQELRNTLMLVQNELRSSVHQKRTQLVYY